MRFISDLVTSLPFTTHPRLSFAAWVLALLVGAGVIITCTYFKYYAPVRLEEVKQRQAHRQAQPSSPAPKPKKETFSVTFTHQVD